MKFKIGDKVKFLNDVGGGVVTRLIDKRLVGVLNEDGFEVPVLESELIHTQQESYGSNSNDDTVQEDALNVPSETEMPIDEYSKDDTDLSLFIGFVPTNQNDHQSDRVELFLINDSNYHLLYTISTTEGKYVRIIAKGFLEDNTKVILKTIPFDELIEIHEFYFQVIVFRQGMYTPLSPLSKTWKLKPAKLVQPGTFSNNDFFHKKAFVYEITSKSMEEAMETITDNEITKQLKEKEKQDPANEYKSPKTNKNAEIEEIDLHIQELIDDYKNLSNGEIVEIQLSRFTTALDGGIIAGTPRMVFIHGVGNGRLKHELRKTLDRKYPNLRYQDASFKEYGYGATMVILK